MIQRKAIHLVETIILVALPVFLFVILNLRTRKEKEISLFGEHGSDFSSRVTVLVQAKGFPYICFIKQKIVDQSLGQLPQDVADKKNAILGKHENQAHIIKKKELVWNLVILFLVEGLLILVAKKMLHWF